MDVFNSLPNGKKVSSIKVMYHDEYGDTPQFDGKYYSWVEFDRKGKIKDITRGTFKEKADYRDPGFITRPYSPFSVSNMVWYLDYGFYPDVSFLAHGPKGWANQKAKMFEGFPSKDIIVRTDHLDNPLEISSTKITHEGPHFDFSEKFVYNNNGKLAMWTSVQNVSLPSGENNSSILSKQFSYNDLGQLISIKEDNKEVLIRYGNDNVVEVRIEVDGMPRLRHEYFYNDLGLRTKSITYNTRNEKEFSQEYEYSYF
jgi:hypothetical protein